MDRLGIARATLVGNSMGGAVAVVRGGATAPERVERLVLIDAAGFNLAPPSGRPCCCVVARSAAGAAARPAADPRRWWQRRSARCSTTTRS